jgi:plastocyanin
MTRPSIVVRAFAVAAVFVLALPACDEDTSPGAPAIVTTPTPGSPPATPQAPPTVAPPAPPLTLACQAQPRRGDVPLTVRFRAFPSGGTGSYAYEWRFGDGGASTQPHPQHTYVSRGSMLATVTVTSGDQAATCERTIEPGTAAGPAPQPPGPGPSPGASPTPIPDLVITIVGDRGTSSYSPNPADVRVGQRVIWQNADVMFHTASGVSFDTGLVAAGASSAPITMTAPGSFSYRCALHSGMVGTLRVVP